MITSLLSLHTYWMINAAIALAYILLRFIFSVSLLDKALSNVSKLKLARYFLLFIVLAFIVMPLIVQKFPEIGVEKITLMPLFAHVSQHVLQPQQTVNQALEQIHRPASLFSFNIFLIMAYILGFSFYVKKYIKNIFYIVQISRCSYVFRRLGRINILVSSVIRSPFCWSGLHKHFIVIPESYLAKDSELKCALQHEFQHIRHKDTYWLHFLTLLKLFCFWNPFAKLWMRWFQETQEFACDEVVILSQKASVDFYAQSLLNAAKNSVTNESVSYVALGVNHLSNSIIYRRVVMLFQYQQFKVKKAQIIFTYLVTFFLAAASVYASSHEAAEAPPRKFTAEQITELLLKRDKDNSLGVVITPEVVEEFNSVVNSDLIRTYLVSSIERMKKFKPYIQAQLKKKSLPQDLIVMPLVQSGYQQMDPSKNPVGAAGIWQIIPETAKNFGLTVNATRDDRLSTELATDAALTYLSQLHNKFQNWGLAIAAYEIGEDEIQKLMDKEKSQDVWVLSRSEQAPAELSHFLAMFYAQVVLMYYPELLKTVA